MTKLHIDRPIFILGPHRSGTTLLYRLLSRHHKLGYLNRGNNRFPRWPRFAHLLTRIGWSDDPREAQRVWDLFWDGSDDAMDASGAPPELMAWYRNFVHRVLSLRGAPRFLAKYPRLSLRLEWLDALFPDAYFIHMVRDWRAVVYSTLLRKIRREKRGGGWFGVRIPGWRELSDVSHERAAGRQFRLVTRALERYSDRFPGRMFKVYYETLCARPIEVLQDLFEKCGLDWRPEFGISIPRDLSSANFKWRENLDPELIAKIREEDSGFYARYEEPGPGA